MYEFTNDCLLNIDTIDDEHRHLFKLINDAFALVKETDDVAPVAKNLLSSLKDYANTHFAHEEAYMESINDPELSLQKKEHAAFSAKINSFKLDDYVLSSETFCLTLLSSSRMIGISCGTTFSR